MMSSSFTRAVISSDQKSVICEYATSAKINLSCDHMLIKKDCAISAYKACQSLKKNYAYDLYLIHSAKVKKVKSNWLIATFLTKNLRTYNFSVFL